MSRAMAVGGGEAMGTNLGAQLVQHFPDKQQIMCICFQASSLTPLLPWDNGSIWHVSCFGDEWRKHKKQFVSERQEAGNLGEA